MFKSRSESHETNWREWDLEGWNERLLHYFFGIHDETPQPVVVLLVTADELARVAGAPEGDADEVRDAFVEAVRSAIRRSGGLLEDAANYPEWPARPRSWSPPPFVAHLLFTCVAASESSDGLSDEASFILRLRDLTHDQLPDHSLQMLPRLWEHLVSWLAETPRQFRPLLLPRPGSLTRIGHTVKLAFPDRRDQKQLSELLARAGLMGHEPPVGRVMTLVAAQRSRFRLPFLNAFDEFRGAFAASRPGTDSQLIQHRFWAAVREASLRGRGEGSLADLKCRLSLLAEEEEDRLAVFGVADHPPDSTDIGFAELPIAYGQWRFALLPVGTATLDAEQLAHASRHILAGSLRLHGLTRHIEQGVIPFAVGPSGLLELATQEQLGEVPVALVREPLVPDLLRLMGNGRTTTRPSSYDGWFQVHDPVLRATSSARLDGTSLSRAWILHDSWRPALPRIVGGVRADDGWLGVREVLPRIVAVDASAVTLKNSITNVVLSSAGDSTWTLPDQDLSGEFSIIASVDGGEYRRSIRFHETPASEVFKAPTDPNAWIVEDIGGTGGLATSSLVRSTPPADDYELLCERGAYLAADVGLFTTDSKRAAWRVVRFGGKLVGSRGSLRGERAMPSNQAASAHARRRWRKLLFDSVPWGDAGFSSDRRRMKFRASALADLPKLEAEQTVPDLAPIPLSSPNSSVGRLVRVLCGRASARSGVDWREWSTLAQRLLDVDSRLLEQVTRAWMEAGLIDVASSARWWHRAVFARLPGLVAFRTGDFVGATMAGLALPTTVDGLRRAAVRLGALVEERYSVSPYVPSTVTVRAPDAETVEAIAGACELRLCWLDLGAMTSGVARRHEGRSAPPEHYERISPWSRWSLTGSEYPNVVVEHHMRPDRPDYWTAVRGDLRLWFYDLNATRAWAAALLGEPVVTAAGDGYIDALHAFLPLPVARAVSILGGGLSGPANARYRYVAGTSVFQQLVLDVVASTFDPSRLHLSKLDETIG